MQFIDSPDEYGQMVDAAYRIRGYFINEIIVAERLMDNFIAKHFTSDIDKKSELIELFIST